MRTETLELIVDSINNDKIRVYPWQLSDSVDFTKIWHPEPEAGSPLAKGYDCYLLKNAGSSEYIGVILDMSNDLHAFLKKEHRGGTFLAKALRETIFPWF